MQGGRFLFRVLVAACAGSILAAVPATADVVTVQSVQGGTDVALIQIASEPAAQARVFLAAPVGRVSTGSDAVDAGADGDARYGARVGGAGSGLVQFSRSRPRVGLDPLVASRPAGLPLASARLTSRFGARRNPLTGLMQRHAGVDLAAPAGAPVFATAGGVVSFAGSAGSYGLLVVLDHGNGLQTRYAHLSRLGVRLGQALAGGDMVGLVGSTGRSTGPHLHYELREQGQAVDPLGH